MAENKMTKVASMFDKKLDEPFTVKFTCDRLHGYIAKSCYFKYDGLFWEGRGPCKSMLADLLTGEAVIVNGRE